MIENFSQDAYRSESYASSPMNWGISQDPSGMILVGNTNGVLSFDGGEWKMIPETENKLFFKFARDEEGRVFTGGDGDLGYFERDEFGSLAFHSLKKELNDSLKEFPRVVNVVASAEGIWFNTREYLLFWDGEKFQQFRDDKGYQKIFASRGKAFAQNGNGYLLQYENGRWKLSELPAGMEAFRIKGVHCIREGSPDTLLIVTFRNGTFRIKGKAPAEKLPGLDARVWNTCESANGDIVLATDSGGVILLQPDGTRKFRVSQTEGLQFGGTKFPFFDRNGSLWIALDKGVSRIDLQLPVSLLGEKQGLKNIPIAIARFEEKIWVGTMNGLFRMERNEENGFWELIRFPGLPGEIWGLQVIRGYLMGSSGKGVFQMRDGEFSIVRKEPATSILATGKNEEQLYLGYQKTLSKFNWNEGVWLREADRDDLPNQVYSLAEDDRGNLWTAFFGGSRIETGSEPFESAAIIPLDSSLDYSSEMEEIQVFRWKDQILFATGKGTFAWEEGKGMVRTKELGRHFEHSEFAPYYFFESGTRKWAYDGSSPGFLQSDTSGEWVWHDRDFRPVREKDTWSIFSDPSGTAWLGTTNQLICYTPGEEKVKSNDFSCHFRSILADTVLLTRGNNSPQSLQFSNNDLQFEFGATWFIDTRKTQYSYLLEGRDEGWSEWSTRSLKEFNDLREGAYTFHVRARNTFGEVSPAADFAFVILPPWYRTWWAYLVWITMGFGIFLGIIRWNTRRVSRKAELARIAEVNREKELRRASVEAQEKERKRIAGDLHDDIQATLSLAKLQVGMISRRLKGGEQPENLTEEPEQTLKDAIQAIRRISHDLMPATLERNGLTSALKEFCKRVRDAGFEVDLQVEEAFSDPGLPVAIGIYRIIQELFSNTHKHAEASRISIELKRSGNDSRIIYADNGKGMDLSGIENQGLGFTNISGRAELIGGKAFWESAPGKGIKFTLSY